MKNHSTKKNIEALIQECEPGQTFIYDDFLKCGIYTRVRCAVVKLCEEGLLVRIAQGVYAKPGVIPPFIQVVKELVRRNNSEIIWDRCYLNEDIYSQYPLNDKYVFYTNGSSRKINYNGVEIIFKQIR